MPAAPFTTTPEIIKTAVIKTAVITTAGPVCRNLRRPSGPEHHRGRGPHRGSGAVARRGRLACGGYRAFLLREPRRRTGTAPAPPGPRLHGLDTHSGVGGRHRAGGNLHHRATVCIPG